MAKDQPPWLAHPSACFPRLLKPQRVKLHPPCSPALIPAPLEKFLLQTSRPLPLSVSSYTFFLCLKYSLFNFYFWSTLSNSAHAPKHSSLLIFQNFIYIPLLASQGCDNSFLFCAWRVCFFCLHYNTNKLFAVMYLHIQFLSYYIEILMGWDKS